MGHRKLTFFGSGWPAHDQSETIGGVLHVGIKFIIRFKKYQYFFRNINL